MLFQIEQNVTITQFIHKSTGRVSLSITEKHLDNCLYIIKKVAEIEPFS